MTDLIELTRKDFSELTQAEKEDLLSEAFRLSEAGDEEGSDEIYRLFPVSARLAKGIKDSLGPETLRRINYNYSEAEALYGKDWLDR
ncbi:hypothetical protein LJC47_04765 [Desulfosarcina sp. OttesenSCG-928-B08]|nr:hypothetical protein [Desulfosarcina sp. OttesenSCG-928-B08]